MMLIVGAVSVNEQAEEKHHGYELLATLPVTAAEIVRSKFTLPVCFGLLYTLLALTLVSQLAPSQTFYTLSQAYILICLHIGLLTVAALYVSIYRFGVSPSFRAVLTGAPIAMVIMPILLLELFENTLDIRTLVTMAENLGQLYTLMIVFLVLGAIYLGLMTVAIKYKKSYTV